MRGFDPQRFMSSPDAYPFVNEGRKRAPRAASNALCPARVPAISPHDWNLLAGLATGAQSLLLLRLAFALDPTGHGADAWASFGAVSAGIAVLASIAGNAMRNRMSRLLPLTQVGQMILSGTLFYAWLWERRWPMPLEITALCFVVLGVPSCLGAHRVGAARPAA